jgi:hypothetical protein
MNYFNYFTEIETRFQERRGSILMLSTLDWALIETWREAGVPLEAVLRGIDAAFDKHDTQRLRAGGRRVRKVNGLAWCAQAVLEAVELSRDAATGATPNNSAEPRESGFESARIAHFLERNAAQLISSAAKLPPAASTAATEIAARLRELTATVSLLSSHSAAEGPAALSIPVMSLEDLDHTLTVLEEKLFAALLTATAEAELVVLREQAARELSPYRGKMQAVQIKQVQQQFLQKRLLEAHSLPRLSLFYMPHDLQHDDLA